MKPRLPAFSLARGFLVGVVIFACFFLISAQREEPRPGPPPKSKAEKKPPPPAEELFQEAESFFQGRETWFGKLVRKRKGVESREYKTWRGIKRKNYVRAAELYQEVLDNYPFSKFAPLSELRLAECKFFMEEYEEAGIRFEYFARKHPHHPEVPYALFQRGMCHYHLMKKPGRDQSETREAILVFTELQRRFPESPYAKQAEVRLKECNQRLAQHELLVADYYFKRKEFWSAAARYRGVWKNYPGLGFDAQAIFMEGACYEALGKKEMAAERYNYVITHFPESEYAPKAKQKLAGLSAKEKPKKK